MNNILAVCISAAEEDDDDDGRSDSGYTIIIYNNIHMPINIINIYNCRGCSEIHNMKKVRITHVFDYVYIHVT